MPDVLDLGAIEYIRVTNGEVRMVSEIVTKRPVMNVQAFLDGRRSGLAKVTWRYGAFGIHKTTAAIWIQEMADRYRIRPEFILTVLQGEQGLVSDPAVRQPMAEIISLSEKTKTVPSVPAGFTARRNGGYWDDCNKSNPNWTRRVADGNWWLAVKGDWKMIAATGAGIADPGKWPPWDVRKYLGFDKQVENIGKLVEKYYTEYNEAVRSGNIAARTIRLYDGRDVIAGDPETFVLLKWTPAAAVLVQRPAINKSYSA